MTMRRWTVWRTWPAWRRKAQAATPPVAAPAQPPRRPMQAVWVADALQAVLAWLLPSSAVVVAALGQFALAIVLCVVAFGIWLRLWRCRVRARRAGRAPS